MREHIEEGTRELLAATRDDAADVPELVHRAVTAFVEASGTQRVLLESGRGGLPW